MAEVGELGGMTKAVSSGMPKLRIEESAARRQARIDRGEEVIVGVNKYRSAADEPVEILDIDTAAVREQQGKRLAKVRDARDGKADEAEMGRASWRERVGQDVAITVGAGQ